MTDHINSRTTALANIELLLSLAVDLTMEGMSFHGEVGSAERHCRMEDRQAEQLCALLIVTHEYAAGLMPSNNRRGA